MSVLSFNTQRPSSGNFSSDPYALMNWHYYNAIYYFQPKGSVLTISFELYYPVGGIFKPVGSNETSSAPGSWTFQNNENEIKIDDRFNFYYMGCHWSFINSKGRSRVIKKLTDKELRIENTGKLGKSLRLKFTH